ncbi:DHA2 family efflux MFS transporter permease subunit [Pelotomaculum propionicicum]|uniref:Multidrug export protein EmrB n=1 Tax=Pelotomaculum propionicicum TaxID=258475 RepID=A0A4Y7RQL7_9FIRM|nr:DHA2 family efflux MFS transporter permease subunit [Pelotomaculum propionicicum]NLI12425.1 DHA2 family efflux MFS transporter permease subunit [Peptococcaceae bacterium]TEB10962.1 Multidrug export protein EmrB [Pelotomaculum propionicicum]
MEETNTAKVPWLTLFALILGVFVSALVGSSITVALPKMMAVFGVDAASIQWVVTAYTLVSGVVVPVSGYLCDRFGAKSTLLFSLIVFTLGCVLCSFAWNNNSLIVFRIIQAVGGGLIIPVVMTVQYLIVPREKIGLAMGVFGIAVMVAPAIGPTLGGILVDILNWQWIFIINIPVGVASILMVFVLLEETPRRKDKRLDVPGVILCSAACFALLLALSQGQKEGWTSLYIVNLIIAAGFGFVLFVIWESIFPEPLLDLRLLNNRTMVFSLTAVSLFTIGLYSGLFLMPLYAQNIMGYTSTQTGMLLLPQALAMAAMMPVSGLLFDKFGARVIGLIGVGLTAYYTYQLHTLTAGISFGEINWILVKRAVGMGLVVGPLMTVGMNTIPKHMTSQGSALSNLFRQIAASIGIPILVSIMTTRQVYHTAWLADTVNWSNPAAVSAIKKLAGVLYITGVKVQAPYSTAAALSILAGLNSKEAFICGIQDAFIFAGIITALGIPLCMFLSKKAEEEETWKQKARFPAPVPTDNEHPAG